MKTACKPFRLGTIALTTATVLLLVAWVRGVGRDEAIALFGAEGRLAAVGWSRHWIGIAVTDVKLGHNRAWRASFASEESGGWRRLTGRAYSSQKPRSWEWILFKVVRRPSSNDPEEDAWMHEALGDWSVVAVPIWLPFVVTALLPAARLFGAIQSWWRVRRGLCRSCGYDIRYANERCPECGDECEAVTQAAGAGILAQSGGTTR